MIATTWTPKDDSNREAEDKNILIDTLRNIKDDGGYGKGIANTLL